MTTNKEIAKALAILQSAGLEIDSDAMTKILTAQAVDVLENKAPELTDDEASDFVARMFDLAAEVTASFVSRETGGQGGGTKKVRQDFGFDTPNGHLYVSVTR